MFKRTAKPARWPLEYAAAAAAVAVVALTAAAIVVPMWVMGARETAALAGRLNDAIVRDTQREIESLFARSVALQETARSVLAAGAVGIHDKVGREALFMGLLRADPAISWVSFGFANGDFYGANRREQGRYRLVESRWNPETRTAERHVDYLVDYEGTLYQTHSKALANDYDASTRGWFEQARAATGPIWTDVYRFASSGRPGLNTAVRVEHAGALLGVVSIAIELDRLDASLRDRMTARAGVAFVLGPNGELIASSEATAIADAGGALMTAPEASGRPVLAAVAPVIAGLAGGARNLAIDHPRLGGRAFLNLEALDQKGWRVGTVLPETAFLGDVAAERRRMILAALAALALTALIALKATQRLFVRPLQAAAAELARYQRFDLSSRRRLSSSVAEIDALGRGLEGARRSLAALARYAPAELARQFLADGHDGQPTVERRTITVLFLDLEGFTAATERLGHRLAPQLNEFLTEMTNEVRGAGGVVDKFIGDAVMALFGAPEPSEDHALEACRAALGCVAALERLNRAWAEEGKPVFRMRIGVNTGRVLVGSIGAPDRLNYSALGDPVNLAARLEGLNRAYGTRIMIGAQTYDLVKYDVAARRLDAVRVKGKTERVPVYELLRLSEGARAEPAEWVKCYEAALDARDDGDFEEARRRLGEAIRLNGSDTAAIAMLSQLPPSTVPPEPPPGRDPAFDRLEAAAAALSDQSARSA